MIKDILKKQKYRYIALMILIVLMVEGHEHISYTGEQYNDKNYIIVIDSIGRKVKIPKSISSIVVTNPYTLELINALGGIKQVKYIGKEIYLEQKNFPVSYSKNQLIGGWGENSINYERIIMFKPQVLILTGGFNWEYAEHILSPYGIKVLVIHSDSSNEFYKNTTLLGKVLGKEDEAKDLNNYIRHNEVYMDSLLKNIPYKRVYYECRVPYRAVIPGEPFNEMLYYAHAENIFNDSNSIHINPEWIVIRNPDSFVRLSDLKESYSLYPKSPVFYKEIIKDIQKRPVLRYMSYLDTHENLLYSYYSHGGAGKKIGAMILAKILYPNELKNFRPDDVYKTWVTKYQKMPYPNNPAYFAF